MFVLAHRCDGLDRGLYRYDGREHALEPVAVAWNDDLELIASRAQHAALLEALPQVVIVLAARFARVSWKYQSIAYSLVLLNAGSALATMCLVAEVARLAVCPVGVVDADLFARASGLSYYEEPAVAQLVLGSIGL